MSKDNQPCYGRALAIWEQWLEADHPHTVTGRENLALLYDAMAALSKLQGRYDKAIEYLEKAHRLASQVVPPLA
ncbi:MAG: tetratricopeptide repeat protein [Cyanobacteria bacterium]|nr:tetratricopeptide repeat protein [Cyanobacteriota bacterium]MDW8203209.1 tetratricopeptide repeat protein [Cyanobacteriota bacterium SKYGB_h_bin112]